MATNDRDFKGVWIPKEVWLDKRMNALEKVILVEIDSLDNGEKHCWISNERLAEFCQCSVTKVSNAITKLTQLEYIKVSSFDGRTRTLQSSLTNSARQTYKECKADLQKVQANNTSNNTLNSIDDNKKNTTYSSSPETSNEPIITMILNDGSEYTVTRKDYDRYTTLYPNVDVMQQLRNMSGWCEANPNKRKMRTGIKKFITSWLIKEQNRQTSQQNPDRVVVASPLNKNYMYDGAHDKPEAYGGDHEI